MSTAYDYSAGAISPAALKAAGVGLVMRYVSTAGNSKNITASEYKALTAAGIQVGLVYETSANWMLGGYNTGLADARSARAQATAVGYPTWQRIWYAADWDASTAQIATVLDALHGAADAEGSKARVAIYGGYDVVQAAAGAGYAGAWQTVAWSGGHWSPAAVLRQTGAQATCGGVQVDVNEVTGAVLLPPPAPIKEEPDMEWTDSITGPGARPNGNEVQYILTDLGRLRDRLYGDTTATVPAGTPLAELIAFLGASAQLPATVAQIQKQVAGLTQPSVDATALATALAGNPAFVSAIAAAVVSQIGSELKPAAG
jgi:hypothetical protein